MQLHRIIGLALTCLSQLRRDERASMERMRQFVSMLVRPFVSMLF
jgi:hypothetical protein